MVDLDRCVGLEPPRFFGCHLSTDASLAATGRKVPLWAKKTQKVGPKSVGLVCLPTFAINIFTYVHQMYLNINLIDNWMSISWNCFFNYFFTDGIEWDSSPSFTTIWDDMFANKTSHSRVKSLHIHHI